MQKNERWLMMLVALLLVIVSVMVFAEYGEDGAVLFDGDIVYPLLMAFMFVAYVVSQTIRDGNLIASFERLQSYMSGNPIMMNELARRYQSLPPLPKQATDTLLDIADALADVSSTDADNKVIDRLREALDSKEKSLEPKAGLGILNQ